MMRPRCYVTAAIATDGDTAAGSTDTDINSDTDANADADNAQTTIRTNAARSAKRFARNAYLRNFFD